MFLPKFFNGNHNSIFQTNIISIPKKIQYRFYSPDTNIIALFKNSKNKFNTILKNYMFNPIYRKFY